MATYIMFITFAFNSEHEEEPEKAGALKIPFSNDGSFLENFKKLSEKLAKTTEETAKRPAEEEAESNM